jgi:hypothetical protein
MNIWASIDRLAVIAQKLEFQRFDGLTEENNEDNAMHNRRPFTLNTWNSFQILNNRPEHRRWHAYNENAREFIDYLEIMVRFQSGTPMGAIVFSDSSSLDFNIHVNWTDPTQLTLEQTGTRAPCPISEEDFNKKGTPQEIYDHLNQVSQRTP